MAKNNLQSICYPLLQNIKMKNKKIKRIKKGNFKRIKNFLFLFILLFILSVNSILAIGITPARTIYNFESGMSKQINFTIINSQEKDMLVVFYIRGDLGKYISLENEYYQFSSDEKNKVFSCNLNLPESLGSPGEHKAEIVAVELPKGIDYKERELTSIGSVVGVITEVFVLVPYPGKYIDAEVNVITSADKIVFAIPIINKGKLDILDTRVIIDLHDSENKKIKTLESNRISIGSLKKNQINLEWDVSDVLPGKYNAKAFIFYDNEVKNLEKSFEIGEQTIEILESLINRF